VPLLPAVAAVVVDAGAPLSEVAVACRDLGIPCVVATVGATHRIARGASVEVDGSTGTVRLAGPDPGGVAADTPTPVTDQHTGSQA
jgi:pyruvate,water dikinase